MPRAPFLPDDLPPNVRGALWMLLAAVLFSSMEALVKQLSLSFHFFEIAFFRAFFGLLWILPFVVRNGRAALVPRSPGLHVLRGVIGTAAMWCAYYAIAHLSLADATALSFTRSLFLTLLGVLLLQERVGVRQWLATTIGFIGVLVVSRPGDGIEWATVVALLGALLVAAISVLLKKLAANNTTASITFYASLIMTVTTFIPAITVWQTPDLVALAQFAAIAAIGTAAQVCLVRAMYHGEASVVAPFDYLRLLIAIAYGYLLFGNVAGLHTLLGGGLIIASTIWATRKAAGK